eukprot:3121562-Pyramimonas_sp.AAC.1
MGATVLVITEIDLETSGASAGRIQSSELGLLPESGLRNYCIVRVILRGAVGFLHLTRAVGGAAGLVMTGVDSQTSDAFVCRI